VKPPTRDATDPFVTKEREFATKVPRKRGDPRTSADPSAARPRLRRPVTTFDRPHSNGHGNGGAPRMPEGPLAPPQNLEAEQSVLGAVLLSDTALPALIIDERLHPEDFYREAHGVIFAAMLELHTAGQNVDALTLVEHLKQSGRLEQAGDRATVDLLAASVPAVGHLRQYARIVRENAMLRRLLRASYEIQARVHSHDAPPRELVDIAERTILEVAHEDSRKDFRAVHDVLFAELDKLEKLSQEGKAITGTPSGFDDLDAITGGFQPGNLIILAARPSMGKSALMANFAENAALDAEQAVALFSLEMSESELAQRFIASQASIKGDDLRKGKVPGSRWGKIMEASNRLAKSPLFIDDSSDLSVLDVRAKARRLLQQHPDGLGLILIDYLQLMRADGRTDNRVEQIGQISRGLKTLARELEVPVIALSQLNRGVEQRTDKRPVLSDLRESGSIEQDADLVMFIYRDEYYDRESEREGIADVIISKHRNGGLGTVELTFQKDYPRFMSYVGDDRY
jgi:replicative DNA helicase